MLLPVRLSSVCLQRSCALNRSCDIHRVSKRVYDYSKMDTDSIKSEMVKVDWEVLSHGSVDEAWRAFLRYFE